MGLVVAVLEDEVGGELETIDVGEAGLLEEREDEVDVGGAELAVEDVALVVSSHLVHSRIDEGVEVEEALAQFVAGDREQLRLEEGAQLAFESGRGGEELSRGGEVAVEEGEGPGALVEDEALLEDGEGAFPEGLLLHEVVDVLEGEALLLLLEVLGLQEVEHRLFSARGEDVGEGGESGDAARLDDLEGAGGSSGDYALVLGDVGGEVGEEAGRGEVEGVVEAGGGVGTQREGLRLLELGPLERQRALGDLDEHGELLLARGDVRHDDLASVSPVDQEVFELALLEAVSEVEVALDDSHGGLWGAVGFSDLLDEHDEVVGCLDLELASFVGSEAVALGSVGQVQQSQNGDLRGDAVSSEENEAPVEEASEGALVGSGMLGSSSPEGMEVDQVLSPLSWGGLAIIVMGLSISLSPSHLVKGCWLVLFSHLHHIIKVISEGLSFSSISICIICSLLHSDWHFLLLLHLRHLH